MLDAILQEMKSGQLSVGISRRKLRGLVRGDIETAYLASLPQSMELSRGRSKSASAPSKSSQRPCSSARLLNYNLDAFAKAFDPKPLPIEVYDAGQEIQICLPN